jgi:undecaprenyl diphosphate synthase
MKREFCYDKKLLFCIFSQQGHFMKDFSSLETKNTYMGPNSPKHIGIIMDGNGRWATQRLLPRVEGHRRGVQRVSEIVECAVSLSLHTLTLFAFSEENWKRPTDEVNILMGLFRWYIQKEKKKIMDHNIRFRIIGNKSRLDPDLQEMVTALETETSSHTGLNLCIAISYGSQQEILQAVHLICQKYKNDEITLSDVTEEYFSQNLQTQGLPDVDLLIRTSGEYRISNFLLWQIAYAELYFEPHYWPDFTKAHFVKIIEDFSKRERRYGQISAQISKVNAFQEASL